MCKSTYICFIVASICLTGNKDWEKLHRREFEKFDSIDVYLQKKRKRAEDMSASVKKTRFVISEVREAVNKLKKKGTPNIVHVFGIQILLTTIHFLMCLFSVFVVSEKDNCKSRDHWHESSDYYFS